MQIFPKRKTAYKFWIKDIVNAERGTTEEGFQIFKIKGKDVSRVNLIASVVNKTENEGNTYATVTLDDGTETIRLKTWKEDTSKFQDISLGDGVLVIGRVRFFGSELYITPELIKKLDTIWLLVRKLELEKEYGKPEEIEKEEIVEEIMQPEVIEEDVVEPTETARQKILELIEKETAQEGAQIGQIIQKSGLKEEAAEKAIDELLKEGEIFQPRKGFLKLI